MLLIELLISLLRLTNVKMSCLQVSLFLVLLVQCIQARDLWSGSLPEISDVILQKGQPISIPENYTKLQITTLEGTLYLDSLSRLNVTELKIAANLITEIQDGALCSSPTVRILDIDFNRNSNPPAMTRHSFKKCEELEELILKFENFYNKLDQDALKNLTSLKKLAIEGNNFPHLTKDFLKVNGASLTGLILSYCNIRQIDGDSFESFISLEEVYVVHNERWKSLPKGLFKNASKLRRLVLRDNGLVNLSWEESSLSSLAELNLMDNQIENFDADAIAENIPQLKEIVIGINPASCKHKEDFIKRLKAALNHTVEVSNIDWC